MVDLRRASGGLLTRLAGAAVPRRPARSCRPAGEATASPSAVLGRPGRLLPARCAGRRPGRLVRHPAGERRPRLVLPRFQPRLRLDDRGLRLDDRQGAAPQRGRAAGLRRAARPDLRGSFSERPPASFRSRTRAGSSSTSRLPDSASLERTRDGRRRRSRRSPARRQGVAHTVGIAGMSFLLQANSSNFASMFVVLKPFDERQRSRAARHGHHGQAAARSGAGGVTGRRGHGVRRRRRSRASAPPAASSSWSRIAAAWGWRPCRHQTDDLVRKLQDAAGPEQRRPRSSAPTRRSSSWTSIGPRSPRSACRSTTSIRRSTSTWARSTSTASTSSAGTGRSPSRPTGKYRDRVEDINLFQVRNNAGPDGPAGHAGRRCARSAGRISITRYNLYTAAAVNGNVPPDVSTGDAIKTVDRLADRDVAAVHEGGVDRADVHADPGRQHRDVRLRAWPSSASSWPWRRSTKAGRCRWRSSWWCRCACSVRWPACCCTHRDVNIFVQIGLVVLVGLACKNAILIVEFAKQLHQEGQSVFDGDAGGVAAAAAADPDDVVRVHLRRRAAGGRRRGPGRRCGGRWGRPSSAACSA